MSKCLLICCGGPRETAFPFASNLVNLIRSSISVLTTRSFENLGVGYLTACLLESGHECDVLDLTTCKPSKKEKIVKKEAKKYEWLGFSFMTYAYPEAMKMAKICKEVNPEAKIVFGGPHASFTYDELLRYPFVDYVVVGEGERAIVDLVSSKELSEIPGLVYRRKDKIIANPPKVIEDLDSLPFPARDKFRSIDYKYLPRASIISTRGCPSKCTFCVTPRLFPKVRFRNPIKVVDELELLSNKGVKEVFFADDDFSISEKHIQEICVEIKKRKISFDGIQAQLSVNYTTGKKLRLMRNMGITEIYFGVESLSPFTLKAVGKTREPALYPKKAIRLLKYAKKLGFYTHSNYILGLPYQRKNTVIREIRILKENSDRVEISLLIPFPGTPDYERFKDRLITKDFSKFESHHIVIETELNNDDIKKIFNVAYPFPGRIKDFIDLLIKTYI